VFEQHMRHIARRYRPVSADEVARAYRGVEKLPRRAVLVTFDDGYRDFGETAWPILRRYRIPAVLFVATGFPDRPDAEFWWDRIYRAFARCSRTRLTVPPLGSLALDSAERRVRAARRVQDYLKAIPHARAMALVERLCDELGAPPVNSALGWRELAALARDGVTLGGHTRTHPVLTRLPIEAARADIRAGREDLQREIGDAPSIFAYPFGAHDGALAEVVREEGFALALSCRRGFSRIPLDDPHRIRRLNVTVRTSLPVLRMRMGRPFSRIDALRQRARQLWADVRRPVVRPDATPTVEGT
jgi:peptidoglycan/xylan/chitin deacetylase (PgdA/CDA1 family)